MEIEDVRDIIAAALEQHTKERIRIVPMGNRVHLYVGKREYEIVIRTMDPKGSSRFDAYGNGPTSGWR